MLLPIVFAAGCGLMAGGCFLAWILDNEKPLAISVCGVLILLAGFLLWFSALAQGMYL